MALDLVNDIYNSVIIYLYALSLLFYFSDCLRRNLGAKRIGAGFLVSVMVLQATYFVSRVWQIGYVVLFSFYDYLILISFIIIVTSLSLTRLRKSEYVILLMNVIGLIIVMANQLWFNAASNPLFHWEAEQGILALHITMAGISFVALSVSSVLALMYLFLHYRLKIKKWDDTIRRLPSLDTMERYTHYSLILGTSLLTVSLLIGIVTLLTEDRWELLFDLKVVATLVSLGIYVLYFIGKRLNRYSGVLMAKWTLIGYAIIIVNFMANSWSEFHRWTGE